jgi:CubicO group peptidase (beta-lactamase class C family)
MRQRQFRRQCHRMLAPLALAVLGVVAATAAAPSMAQENLAPPGQAPSLSADQIAALDLAVEQVRDRFGVPGLAVGIVLDGVPVYARGYGVRDTETGAPVTPSTLFHAASLSKTFTAMAVLQLAEQGRLTLDDPLERHLPGFAGSGITLMHLLTHTAGFQDWRRAAGSTDDAAVAGYVAEIAGHELAYPPGTGWEYSDTAFNILGAVIEASSGKTYPSYLQEEVLAAAGMTGSTFRFPDQTAEIAWPHRGEILVRRAAQHPWDRVFLPSSGLQTSIKDLLRWAVVHLDRDPALLSPASYEALFRYRIDTAWPGVAMGLGWQLERRGQRLLPRHPGGDRGFRALLTLYPEERRAIAILSNGETTPRVEIRSAVEAILAGETPVLPQPPLLQRPAVWMLAIAALILLTIGAAMLRRRRRRTSAV